MISDNELKMSYGGVIKTTWIALSGIFTFLIGFIDGYLRPLKCNK